MVKEFLKNNKIEILKCSLIILIVCIIHILTLNIIAEDYRIYLHPWIEKIIENGRIHSLSLQIGNYFPPYMLLLTIGTYITSNDLLWIKLISFAFDILIGIFSYKIAKHFHKEMKPSRALLILLLPGVILNSGVLGQCDGIYTAFLLMFIAYILENKSKRALFFFGVALSFKIQAIFLAPILLYLLLKKRIKWYEILIFIPIGYVLLSLPHIIASKNIWYMLDIFKMQINFNSIFSGSCPNFYAWIGLLYVPIEPWITYVLTIGTILFCVMIVISNTKRKEYLDQTFLEKCMLLSLVVPFFLPNMLDRYFYVANVLIFIVYILVKKVSKMNIVLVSFFSLACFIPTFGYNFLMSNEASQYFVQWIGIKLISSTIVVITVLFMMYEYILNPFVNKLRSKSR